jgi:hypothetical protein
VTDEKLDEINYRVPGPELLIHHQVHHIENTDTTAAGNPDVAEKLSKELGKENRNYQAHEGCKGAKMG